MFCALIALWSRSGESPAQSAASVPQRGAGPLAGRGWQAGVGAVVVVAAVFAACTKCGASGKHTGKDHDWLHDLNHWIEGGSGSAILGVAAVVSMLLANVGTTAEPWTSLWNMHVGPPIGGHALTLKGWINEGLMALFFFQVGLEIKKELTVGGLASPAQAALPCIAAVGGMVTPMAVYVFINTVMDGGSFAGVTIPMATDIAFAMGVFSLFRKVMPASSEPFLLALATADDLGAIAVIAVFFASTINPLYLALAVATLLVAAVVGHRNFYGSSGFYVVPGVALWYFMLRGGVNADVAGVLVALCIPMKCLGGHEVVERLIHRWIPVSSLFVLPLFALANCAVKLGADSGDADGPTPLTVPLGVALGLLVGKPLGIFGFTWVSVKAGISPMPKGMANKHVLIVGMLGAIGFTMCLFLIENSLTGKVASLSKLSVLLTSLAAAIFGAASMATLSPVDKRRD